MPERDILLDLGFRRDAALAGRFIDGLLLGAQPLIVAIFIVEAIGAERQYAPLWCAMTLAAIVVLRRLLLWPASRRLYASAYGGGLRLRRAILQHLVLMPLGAFRTLDGGKLIQAISEDVLWLENHASYTRPEIGANAAAMTVCMVGAAIVWPFVGVTAIIIMILGFAALALARRMLVAGLDRRAGSLAAAALVLQEQAEGIAVLRTFAGNGDIGDDFARSVMRLSDGAWRGVRRVTPIAVLFRMTIDLSAAASVLVAVLALPDGEAMATDVVRLAMAGLLVFSATVPARNFASLTAMLILARLGRRNIGVTLAKPALRENETVAVPSSFDVVYRNLCFTHKGREEPALYDVSFEAGQGQMIALVGASGSGKTTCLQLMMGFFHADAGDILIGGRNIRDIGHTALAAMIAPVFQETLLFDDTIANNIRIGRPSASDANVMQAARSAAIHEVILRFEDGYDTVVGALGSRLSGGERQRICIARAILKNAPIVILDEATSALDPENEEAIQRAVSALSAGRTLFVIAHNLRSVVHADRILMLEAGRIVASGSHEILLRTSPSYRRLWDRSAAGRDWTLPAQ